MEIIKLLPQELKWNVFKFMEHPVAKIFKSDSHYQTYVDVHRSTEKLIEAGIIDEGFSFVWIWSREKDMRRESYTESDTDSDTDSEDSLRPLAR